MNQSSYSPDTFGTYLSNPDRKVSGIDLSSASVLDETGNCYSTIKLYCNQLKAAMSWASKHGCLLSQTVIPKLTYSILKKYGYYSPYRSTVSNYDKYLHTLMQIIGEEFNDIVITEVKIGGMVIRSENRKWELCTSHTGRRTFISYNVMRCPTEAEVRKCSGHKSTKTFERYITFDDD